MGRVRATRTKSRDCGGRGKSRSLIGRGGFKCLALIGSQERGLHVLSRSGAARPPGPERPTIRPGQARPESEETGRKWQLKWGGVQWGRPSRPAWPARTGRRRQHPLSPGWGGVGRSSRPSTRPPWPPWAAVPWPAGRSPGRQLASYLTPARLHPTCSSPMRAKKCHVFSGTHVARGRHQSLRLEPPRGGRTLLHGQLLLSSPQCSGRARAALDRVSQADAA